MFGTPDQVAAAPRRRDLLEDVVKDAREGGKFWIVGWRGAASFG
jgi:hypothetical protein